METSIPVVSTSISALDNNVFAPDSNSILAQVFSIS